MPKIDLRAQKYYLRLVVDSKKSSLVKVSLFPNVNDHERPSRGAGARQLSQRSATGLGQAPGWQGSSGMAGKNGRYAVVASAEDDAELLEEGKLLPEPEQITAAAVCAELGHGLALAGPTVVIQLCNMFAWTLTTSMVGSQLGVDALTGASLANLAGNLTGLSIVYGTLSAMDTLAPRCVGTGQYSELGLLSQRASALCFLLMLPVCVMWWNVEYLLSAAGQPPAACALAGQFLRIYILQMPSLICLEVCRRFCIVQDIIVFFIPVSSPHKQTPPQLDFQDSATPDSIYVFLECDADAGSALSVPMDRFAVDRLRGGSHRARLLPDHGLRWRAYVPALRSASPPGVLERCQPSPCARTEIAAQICAARTSRNV